MKKRDGPEEPGVSYRERSLVLHVFHEAARRWERWTVFFDPERAPRSLELRARGNLEAGSVGARATV